MGTNDLTVFVQLESFKRGIQKEPHLGKCSIVAKNEFKERNVKDLRRISFFYL